MTKDWSTLGNLSNSSQGFHPKNIVTTAFPRQLNPPRTIIPSLRASANSNSHLPLHTQPSHRAGEAVQAKNLGRGKSFTSWTCSGQIPRRKSRLAKRNATSITKSGQCSLPNHLLTARKATRKPRLHCSQAQFPLATSHDLLLVTRRLSLVPLFSAPPRVLAPRRGWLA